MANHGADVGKGVQAIMTGDRCVELAAAVIRRAIDDLKLLNSTDPEKAAIGRDAYRFVSGKGLECWCAFIGLNVEYIRKQINKTCDLSKKIAFTPKSQE